MNYAIGYHSIKRHRITESLIHSIYCRRQFNSRVCMQGTKQSIMPCIIHLVWSVIYIYNFPSWDDDDESLINIELIIIERERENIMREFNYFFSKIKRSFQSEMRIRGCWKKRTIISAPDLGHTLLRDAHTWLLILFCIATRLWWPTIKNKNMF